MKETQSSFGRIESCHDLLSAPGNSRNSEGAFIERADGAVVYVYSRYAGDDWRDNAEADLAEIRLAPGSAQWTEPRVIMRHEGNGNLMSVSFIRLRDGRIAMFFLKKTILGNGHVDCRPMISCSSDECATWSKPRFCVDRPGFFVLNNDRAVQLSSGRIMLSLAEHEWRGSGIYPCGRPLMRISDNDGATWRDGAERIAPPEGVASGLQEPGIIELADGRLMSFMRTDAGFQYKSFSEDCGEHWTPAVPATEFPSPCSPLSMRRDPASRKLVAVWNDTSLREEGVIPTPPTMGRTPLVIAESVDEGATWTRKQVLEDDPTRGYCYTAMLFQEGSLLLAYCFGGGVGPDAKIFLQDLRIARIKMRE